MCDMHHQTRPERLSEKSNSQKNLAARVREALHVRDLPQACRLLEAAIRQLPANATLRFQLAVLRHARGDRAGAAVELSRALRHEPGHRDAAHRLSEILSQGRLPANIVLDAGGLANCLTHRTVDRDLIAAAALRQLTASGPLAQALARCRTQGPEAVARDIIGRRSSEILRDGLLRAVMSNAIVADKDVEWLLTAIRRCLLLDLPADRMAEPDLLRFATAMVALCANNEYVFAVSDDEQQRLSATPPNLDASLAGDRDAGIDLMRHALYRNPAEIVPSNIPLDACRSIAPAEFGTAFLRMLNEHRTVEQNARQLPRYGKITSEISLRVAGQYRTHPYPRWQGVALFPGGQYIGYLQNFFSASHLKFTEKPFEVLIAGCGTGCQAVSAALDYGQRAKVTAIDISESSLGYAVMMADRLEAPNVAFALADIDDIGAIEPTWTGRYAVIECSGVLHHMAQPFDAWKGLLACLAPGGIMLVGLYSAIARQDLVRLRAEPEFPGAGCNDDRLRAYRRMLLDREDGQPGASFMRSRDVFTTSGFRDFFLHVSEQTTTIPEISAFLEANGLVFKGFVNVPFETLAQRFPEEVWPGRLERWADLETEKPSLFIGMYQFWIARR